MKSLYEYFIQEKLKIDKDVKETDMSKVTINIPKKDDYDKPTDETWRSIEIPYKKWVIFIDCYHRNNYHFACLSDFLYNFFWCQDDYEDFNPTKDILYASDSLDDAFDWYTDKLIKEGILTRNRGSYQKKYRKNNNKCYDCEEFFDNVESGEWKEKDLMMNSKYPKREEIDGEKFKEYINTMM